MGIKKMINQAANLTISAIYKASDISISAINKASDITFEKLDAASERLNTAIDELKTAVDNTTASVIKAAKVGAGFAAFKFCSDVGISWYRAIKLTRTANDAKDAFKAVADNTSKAQDEIVNVIKNTSGDLKSSVGQFTEDVHKMSQNLGHMTESISQSSAEISGAANQASRNFGYMTHVTSDFFAYLSQDMHQTSHCFRVTCFSLTTFALVATMNSLAALQNSSCDQDKESMLCTVPLKSMAAATITTGFLAIRMLMPNRVQVHQKNEILAFNETTSVMNLPDQVLKEDMDLSFLIPEEGIDQNIEWTEEQLDSIKAINFDVFNFIEIKNQLGSKWDKQDLEWLLIQDKNIFLKVLLGRAYTTIDHLDQVLKEDMDLSFLIPEEGIDQNIEWTEEQLDSIKAINFDVFNFIEIKNQLGSKWDKQDLEWLLIQDKNIFLKVLLSKACATADSLNNN